MGLTLRGGESITDFRVELMPAATIRVRVVDEYGDPLARAGVQIEAASQNDPLFRMHGGGAFAFGMRTQTDDRGEFVAIGLPGKYYVSANLFGVPRPATRNELRTDGTTDPVYSRTYFPNSVSKEGATWVEVKPGEEAPPIEIRISRQQNLSISGVISGFPPRARPFVNLFHSASSDGTSGPNFTSMSLARR